MRQAGRYLPEYQKIRRSVPSFLELCLDPAKATEVTLQPIRRFGLDAAILFSDILVVPYALGQPVDFESGTGPRLSPVRSAEDVGMLGKTGMGARLSPVYETVERISAALPDETCLIGFAGAPWTVAAYMVEGGTSRDFMNCKRWALGEPESFSTLIELLVDATVDHLLAQIQAGAEAVQLFDTWASALPPNAFQRFSVSPLREIAKRVKENHPDVPVIAFLRGVPLALPHIASCPEIDVVSIDQMTDPAWAAGAVQPHAVTQGNLDPVMLLVGGNAMIENTQQIMTALSGGAHIFNLGHGVLPGTPPENVAALVKTVREWRT